MPNIYYNPEQFGLEVVGEVEWSDENYQFDTTVVWRDKETGVIYYASDSGCSCPTPFELDNRDSIIEMVRLQELIDYLEERKSHGFGFYGRNSEANVTAAIGELMLKVKP